MAFLDFGREHFTKPQEGLSVKKEYAYKVHKRLRVDKDMYEHIKDNPQKSHYQLLPYGNFTFIADSQMIYALEVFSDDVHGECMIMNVLPNGLIGELFVKETESLFS